jgi:hypothetical protein
MSLSPGGQAIKLYCETEQDFSGFIRAYHLDPENASLIFARESYFQLAHGLYLMTMTLRLDMLKDEESTTTIQQELPIHG